MEMALDLMYFGDSFDSVGDADMEELSPSLTKAYDLFGCLFQYPDVKNVKDAMAVWSYSERPMGPHDPPCVSMGTHGGPWGPRGPQPPHSP